MNTQLDIWKLPCLEFFEVELHGFILKDPIEVEMA